MPAKKLTQMSQQKVCQPLVCAISHRGSSLSCWNTVKKTIFPGKLPGPGLSTPAERAQVSCSRVIITNINTLFKFMSNRPVVVQNECHPYLPAREVRSICKENEIVFQVYIMSHILIHLFSHARLNPKCYFLGLFLVSRLTPALVPAFSLSWRILR